MPRDVLAHSAAGEMRVARAHRGMQASTVKVNTRRDRGNCCRRTLLGSPVMVSARVLAKELELRYLRHLPIAEGER